MNNRLKLLPPAQTIIYLTVIYIVGIVGMLTEATRSIFIFLVPVNILMVIFIAALYHKGYNTRFIIASLMVYLGGFVIEWLGVKTGLIFGPYSYGEGLGIQVAGVPLIMGINWLLLVYGSTVIAGRIFRKRYLIALFGAILMVIYDVFLEPSAIAYNFWKWETEGIPMQNYMAWFVCAYLFISFFQVSIRHQVKNIVAEAIFWLQLVFFGITWLANNLTA